MCNIQVPVGIKARELKNHSIIGTDQKSVLEKAFAMKRYPSTNIEAQLANQTGLSEASIRGWFQRTRKKIRCSRVERPNYISENTFSSIRPFQIVFCFPSYVICSTGMRVGGNSHNTLAKMILSLVAEIKLKLREIKFVKIVYLRLI